MSKSHPYRCFCPSLFLVAVAVMLGVFMPRSVSAENFSSISSDTQKVFPTADPTPELEHWHVGAYYDLERFPSAKLLLNNKDIVAREVRTTLYRMDGTPFEAPPTWVGANSAIKVDLADWAALAGQGFTRGSLRIYHTGKDRVIGSQIFLEDNAKGISFEERLAELGKFNSKRMEGVWYMPRSQSDAFIVVSNTSDQIINVSARLSRDPKISGPLEQISLNPHQTRVFNIRNDFQNGSYFMSGKVVGIAITHTGGNSDLKVHGAVMDVPKGYSNVIQFSNPDTAKSSELHGVGFRLGQFNGEELEPIVVAKNVSAATASITGKINYTRTNGTTGSIQLGSANVKAGELRSFNLQQVINRARNEQIEIAGIEVTYNAPAGSFIVSAQSVGPGLDQVFRVPMYDPYAQVSSTGGYPFRIEGTSTTYAFVKNTTNVEKEYVTYMIWPNGGEYMIGLRTIAPGQTVQIDVKKLRDEQIQDERGNTIPLNISEGQIRWTIRHEEFREDQPLKKFELVGRSEQVDTANKTSSSYACQNCCEKRANGYISSGGITNAEVGDQIQFTAYEQGRDCNGAFYFYQISNNDVDWDSSDDNIATVSNTGLVTIVGVGDVEIDGDWWVDVSNSPVRCPLPGIRAEQESDYGKRIISEKNYTPLPNLLFECANCSTVPFQIDDQVDLEAKPKLRILRDGQDITNTSQNPNQQNVIVGQKINLSAQVTGGGTPSSRQWTIPGTRIADYIVTFTSETAPTSAVVTQVSNLTQTSVQYHWVDSSSEIRNVQYSVTVGGKTYSAMARFNVVKPTGTVTGQIFGTPSISSFNGDLGMWFGTSTVPGISFTRSMTVPTGFAGDFQWVQIWNKFRRVKQNNRWYRSQGSGLDTVYPYESGATANDSPGIIFDPAYQAASVDETFDMYLMFKPADASAVWVPLKKVSWGWSAQAVNTLSVWSLDGTPTKFANPSSDVTTHPLWSVNATQIDYSLEP